MRYLRENWIWIVGPIVIVLLALFAFIKLTEDTSGTDAFDYPIF